MNLRRRNMRTKKDICPGPVSDPVTAEPGVLRTALDSGVRTLTIDYHPDRLSDDVVRTIARRLEPRGAAGDSAERGVRGGRDCSSRHLGPRFALPLPIGVVGHEGSTVLVCLNGLRLLAYRGRAPADGIRQSSTIKSNSQKAPDICAI